MRKYKSLYLVIAVFIFFYAVIKVAQSFSDSLFFTKSDRVNFVIYGSTTAFYSIDLVEDRHYIMLFPPDVKIDVPGGYGKYRIGSLGKLSMLEKDPDIIKRSFAHATSSFIDSYFYDNSDMVYYGTDYDENFQKPPLSTLLLDSANVGIINRVYLILKNSNIKESQFKKLAYLKEENKVLGDMDFVNDSFSKKSQGFFYQQKYRVEKQSVQIRYTHSRATANGISVLLEGNGIRVSNVAFNDKPDLKKCEVWHSETEPSETSKKIAEFFDCRLIKNKTDVYDIVFYLNKATESKWEINN